MFGVLKGLVGSKTLTRQDMEPVLEKMKDHLIGTPTVFHAVAYDSQNYNVLKPISHTIKTTDIWSGYYLFTVAHVSKCIRDIIGSNGVIQVIFVRTFFSHAHFSCY